MPLKTAIDVAEAFESQRPVAGEGMSSVLPLAVDGSERAFRLRTTPMRDNGKHLLGAVTILEDITHLREIDQIKSEFIATASHDLRTPLTSVQMGVHLLLEGALGDLNDSQNEVLQACRQDCDRLDKLMRDLLDLSKIEAEHEVLVQIDEEAVGYVERMTRRQLPAENSFWTTQAQRLLGDYLWKEGKVPPTRKLTIKDIDRDELPIAARWQSR